MRPSTVESGRRFPSGAVPSGPPGLVRPLDHLEWPTLWARCWSRIRTWQVPPRWSQRDWRDEARAQAALAACEALRAFEPGRLVPLDAFLYRRVVASVWTRYRQEWSFGRRCRPEAILPDRPESGSDRPESELLDHLAAILGTLDERERRLIRQLFWDGRAEDDLVSELGVTRQAVNKRKQKLLRRLRFDLIIDRNA